MPRIRWLWSGDLKYPKASASGRRVCAAAARHAMADTGGVGIVVHCHGLRTKAAVDAYTPEIDN